MERIAAAPPIEILRFLEQSRAGCAVVIGATIAIGSCTLAACGEDAASAPRLPPVGGARANAELEEEPDGLALEAEQGRIGTFEASPGFTPDPMTHEGALAGGPFEASELDAECSGWIAADPDFVFSTPRPFAELAVMAASRADTTLVIVGPDGDARCADDSDGTQPIVRGLYAPGLYRVWVGATERDAHTDYVLALSELDDSSPSALLH